MAVVGGLICLLLISPYILWNAANHWTTLAYWSHYSSHRLYVADLQEYLTNLFYSMNPVLLPLFALGLYRLFRRPGKSNDYFLGVMFLLSFAVVFQLHARTWMLAEMFVVLIAAGAAWLEETLEGMTAGAVIKPAIAVAVLAGGVLVAPANLPVIPVKDLPAYAQDFNFLYRSIRDFNGISSEYPVYFSLRFGWEDLVRPSGGGLRRPFPAGPPGGGDLRQLVPAGRRNRFLGPRYGLPQAVSGHLTYYFWGPGKSSWDVMIVVAFASNDMAPFFKSCERKAALQNDFAAGFYNRLAIFVCRRPRVPPEKIWSSVQDYS